MCRSAGQALDVVVRSAGLPSMCRGVVWLHAGVRYKHVEDVDEMALNDQIGRASCRERV